MTSKSLPIALCIALTAAACGEVLRLPDAVIAPAQSSAEAPAYEISEVIATSEAIARANAMPFLAQVTLGGAGETAARRVSASEATSGQMPPAGARPTYLIGAGDVLRVSRAINVVDDGGLETEQLVTSDLRVSIGGSISLTDAGRVQVAGQSIEGARLAIAAAYEARSSNAGREVAEVEFPRDGDPEYSIGPGDLLRVSRAISVVADGGLEAEQSMTSDLRVDTDGSIGLTDAGRVKVAGQSIEGARSAIAAAYEARSSNAGREVAEVEFPRGGDTEYLIGPGDLLSVSFIISSTNLSGGTSSSVVASSSPVGSDGVATFLQVGAVEVGGLSLSDAQRIVGQAALRGNAATSQVQLNVTSYQSQSIIISGDIESQLFRLQPGAMSIDTLLASAGLVVSPTVDYLVTLERGATSYQMRASRLLSGASRGLYLARDGDRYIVRKLSVTPDFNVSVEEYGAHRVSFLDLSGEVTSSDATAILTLTDAGLDLRTLLLARGVKATREADALVRLVRRGSEYRASAREILIENPGKRVWLEPGDDVIVEPLKYVASQAVIVGQVGAPQAFPIDRAARSSVSEALFSGGLFTTPGADFKHVYVLRQRDGTAYDAYHFDLSEVLNIGLTDRMELRPGDVIFVRTNPIVKFGTLIDVLIGLNNRRLDLQGSI